MRTLGDDIAAAGIAAEARHEKNSDVRYQLLQSLRGRRGSVTARELRRFATSDPDETIRWAATHFAGKFSPGSEDEFLMRQAGDQSRLVRLAALTERAKFGDQSGRDAALQTIIISTVEAERYEAMDLLGAIGNPADIPLLKRLSASPIGHNSGRQKATCASRHIELLQMPQADRLPFLIAGLDDPSESVRSCIYVELYQSTDPRTNSDLRDYLKRPGRIGFKEASNALSSR
jgi:hypothetical protein